MAGAFRWVSLTAPDKDSDNARNRERNVGKRWGTYIAKGVAIALLYGIAYLALRYVSFNQWFLPAGLRAACLLFMPYRYWPFIFLGEAGLTFSKKIQMIDDYGALWVYVSPLLMPPLAAVLPFLVRRKLGTSDRLMRWIPVPALLMACWTTLCNFALNRVLDGPAHPDSLKSFVGFVIGDYLGVLTALILVFLWLKATLNKPMKFPPHAS
jgi:hypothetical protein